MNSLFKCAYALRNKYEGPLGRHMDSYAAQMLEQGYAKPTVVSSRFASQRLKSGAALCAPAR